MEAETYNEEDLMNIFTDILAHEEPSVSAVEIQPGIYNGSDHSILSTVAGRLMVNSDTSSQFLPGAQNLASRLRARQPSGNIPQEGDTFSHQDSEINKTLQGRILLRLEEITKKMLPVGSISTAPAGGESAPELRRANLQSPSALSIGILSESEWKALLRSFVSWIFYTCRKN